MSAVGLRAATDSDAEFMCRVYASTRTEELAQTPWPDDVKESFLRTQSQAQLAHYRQYYPNSEHLVITLEGADIGRLLVDRSGEDLRLMDIALLPEYRGSGIGSRLVRDLIDEAESMGRPMVLHVEAFNRAYGFYEREGFVDEGQVGVYRRMYRASGAVVA